MVSYYAKLIHDIGIVVRIKENSYDFTNDIINMRTTCRRGTCSITPHDIVVGTICPSDVTKCFIHVMRLENRMELRVCIINIIKRFTSLRIFKLF